MGRVQLAKNPCEETQNDQNGNLRRVWVFPLQSTKDHLSALPLIRIRFSNGIARQPLLASLWKVLAPPVIQIGVNAFP